VATFYDEYQRRLHERRWTWDDIPFYEGSGARQSIAPLHDLDYLDVYERVYGRRIGATGIGRLREVALTRRAEQEEYAAALEAEGVVVHEVDAGEKARAGEVLVVNGGAIVPGSERAGPLADWLFWNLNVPTLRTIAGGGAVAEAGTTRWLARDVYVVGLSIAYNEAGLDQLVETVRLTAGVDDLAVLTIRCQGNVPFDRDTGATAWVDHLVAPLDAGKVLAYKPGIDTATLLWLERNGFEVVEPVFDEHLRGTVGGVTLLEPGRVIMPAGARGTIDRVRAAGVEVLEVPDGAPVHSRMELLREPGP